MKLSTLTLAYAADAEALAASMVLRFPMYDFEVCKPKGCRRYRIRLYCRSTNAFLQYVDG